MKGQSAIEYLMSYGWMLLVVALVAAAIFSFVNNRCVTTTSGFNGEEIAVTDFAIATDDQYLVLEIENRGPDSAEIKNITIDTINQQVQEDIENVTIESGSSDTFPFTEAFQQTGQCNSYDMNIVYDQGGLGDRKLSGEITGSFEFLESPSSPQIESIEQ